MENWKTEQPEESKKYLVSFNDHGTKWVDTAYFDLQTGWQAENIEAWQELPSPVH